MCKNHCIVAKLYKRMTKTAWKNPFICRFDIWKADFCDFLHLGVSCSSLRHLIQINYWVQTKMRCFPERRELVVKDGSCFTAVALAKFAQWGKMRNFSALFGDFSNMWKFDFSEFSRILNSGCNSALKWFRYIKNMVNAIDQVQFKYVNFSLRNVIA